MSSDPQKDELDQTLGATTDIDSLLGGGGAAEEMFPPDLGAPLGGPPEGTPAAESQVESAGLGSGEQAAEGAETEEAAEEEEKEKKPGVLSVLLGKFDTFTSLLMLSLLALILGCYFLWIEWGRYNHDTKAKSAKTHAAVSVSIPWVRPVTRI
jgi:hypothetical protein